MKLLIQLVFEEEIRLKQLFIPSKIQSKKILRKGSCEYFYDKTREKRVMEKQEKRELE